MKRPSRSGINNEPRPKTLLIDSNALLKFGFHGAKNEYNHFGEHIGGLYQFLTITRKLLDKITFDNVFAFWDGPLSGKLRYNIHEDYKSNRDKNFTDGTFSQDKDLVHQKKLVWNYLEQLCIKQLEDYVVESDDLIAQYIILSESDENEEIYIFSRDKDYLQLISDKVFIISSDSFRSRAGGAASSTK
jgi:5'-3' exonuclease